MRATTRFVNCWCLVALLATVLIGSAPVSTRAASCTELIVNGGFETNDSWTLGVSPIMPQYVTYTRHSGNRALALGITSGANVASFSSARQAVTIPATVTQATLTFWFYAMASSPATTDYMELVLLDASGTAILAKPWQSHNDSRLWNQLSFDLSPWRGQTVQVYFNVYNDGVGGAAALFLDDVSLQACTGTPVATGTPAATLTAAPTATSAPSPSATPGCVTAVVNGGFESGLASWEAQGDPRGIALSTTTPHSGSQALRLGALDQSINDFTSVRQQVTIPVGFSQVKLTFWTYTFLEPNPGNDYQRAELLDTVGNPITVLWNEATNKRAWERQEIDLASRAGQTVFLRFGVNNDGSGGRAAMYLDDVLIQACNPGPTPTNTSVATGTPAPTATRTPTGVAPTYTSIPSGCKDLTLNGGFESGMLPWRPGATLLPPAVVSDLFYEGAYAARLGSQSENRNSYSSIRQTVTVPWGYARVEVRFWAYTWAESLTGGDRQQFAVLGTDGAMWAMPWSVLEDAREWQLYRFDLVGASGQVFDLYFNAYNDGVGGRTALFVDQVELWGCTADVFPPEPGITSPAGVTGERSATPARQQPGGAGAPAATPWGEMTRVAINITPAPQVGLAAAPGGPTPAPGAPAAASPSTSAPTLTNLLTTLKAQFSRPVVLSLFAIIIVALLLLLLLRATRS